MDVEPEPGHSKPPKCGAGCVVSVLVAIVATLGGACSGDMLGMIVPVNLDPVHIVLVCSGAIGGAYIGAAMLSRIGNR